MDKYDIANWRPCTPAQYVEHMAHASMTHCEPDTLRTDVEVLDGGGRMRLVTYGEMRTSAEVSQPMPYLMILHQEEDGKTLCFVANGELVI